MTEPAEAQPRPFTSPFAYDYPQASPCGAILIYHRSHNTLTLLTSLRANIVGDAAHGKRNHAAGGFYEVKDMFNEAAKTQDGDAELYREMTEELGPGIKNIIPYDRFVERREYLWDGMTRIRDTHIVHMQVHKTLEVTDKELSQIFALPPTEERLGFKLEKFEINDSQYIAPKNENYVREKLADFLYPTEVDMAVKWYQKLEKQIKAQTDPHPGGW